MIKMVMYMYAVKYNTFTSCVTQKASVWFLARLHFSAEKEKLSQGHGEDRES